MESRLHCIGIYEDDKSSSLYWYLRGRLYRIQGISWSRQRFKDTVLDQTSHSINVGSLETMSLYSIKICLGLQGRSKRWVS